MAKVEGLQKVVDLLRARLAVSSKDRDVSVTVGYTASYSVYVHENLESYHPVGQAKFLEQPAREYADVLKEIIKNALKQKKTLSQALLLAGLRLQRESQLLCPVLTGNLKSGAFTRLNG